MGRRGKAISGVEWVTSSAPSESDDPVEALVQRARKSRLRGDQRKALVLLREACAIDEWRARTWAILGAFLMELGRSGEAVLALRQARWLRVREGDRARAAVLDLLIAGVTPAAA